MQPVGRSHVNSVFKQTMDETGIEMSVQVSAVVAVVVNSVSPSEVNLEHGTKTLHDSVDLAAAENLAQA